MQLNGIPLVRVEKVRPYYVSRGLSTELLDKCNSQEFRYIDGYGKGHFLMMNNISSENVTLSLDSRTVSLRVLEKLSLEHASHSGGLYLYITAEPKYALMEYVVGRNYNVTIDKSLNTYGTTTIHTLAPDLTAKTMRQVVEDIATNYASGYSIDWYADDFTSFDINIEGLTVLRALDLICSIYGLVWTADNNTIYIWDLDGGTPSSSEVTTTIPDPINDVRNGLTDISDVRVLFPIYQYCRKEPSEYYSYSALGTSTQGTAVTVMDPWYPAVANSLGTIVNSTLLNARGELIEANLQGIESLETYKVKHKFYLPAVGTTPLSLSEIHGDFGAGPRSIYRSIPYPLHRPIQPPSKARLANRWIGEITDGYFGNVAKFVVTPLYGLDGKAPTGDQIVTNLYGWSYGEPGWTIGIEWDCSNERWIPFQQQFDCPPTEDPEYPTPGPDSDYPFYPLPPFPE